MVIVVTLKDIDWKHRYEDVISVEIKPKSSIKDEVDETTFDEMDNYIFRMNFKDGDTATFSINSNFDYKVMSYKPVT